jgi:hypothetical protein
VRPIVSKGAMNTKTRRHEDDRPPSHRDTELTIRRNPRRGATAMHDRNRRAATIAAAVRRIRSSWPSGGPASQAHRVESDSRSLFSVIRSALCLCASVATT